MNPLGLIFLPVWAGVGRCGLQGPLCHGQLTCGVILGRWFPSSILPSFREGRRNEKLQEE